MTHPYKHFSPRHFWSRSVAGNFDPSDVATVPTPLMRKDDKVCSAGSCFAANLIPFLETAGFQYIRAGYTLHEIYRAVPGEFLNYDTFSAGYGNIYTTRQLYQLLLRCLGRFTPREGMWVMEGGVFDPFRPGLRYHARSVREFNLLTAAHLAAVLEVFSKCTVFIFTLGLTEAWFSKADGAVFPACPGTIAGRFDPEKHGFINFQCHEVLADLLSFIALLREINPGVRIILTVSPVPLVATATDAHVLSATVYSKSVLRVAAEEACRSVEDVHYFPAYEIATGVQAPYDFFEQDRRNVSAEAIKVIMTAFLDACEKFEVVKNEPDCADNASASLAHTLEALAKALTDAECEEMFSDDAL